ncbi:chemotaxis protein CheW [Clostridium tetani]|uniref:chemotaxis protein CheW n=1 Tax=Clostridium tetani TaxID=1513 RepID=UPI00100A32B7|nr:chemotaxis protein CheW [Clostridium tetani]RXM78551.1 chemotaxis protein CheW [Clostridium tetani]RYU99849.1 chemotaxis protein CheW [Clostridium tetani]
MENKEEKILIFGINDELYATDIMEVERILGFEEPTRVPDSPSFVEGVINYEGNILPIICLSKKFNIPKVQTHNDSDKKIIVVKDEKSKIGILVDIVFEVRDINKDNIEEPPGIVAGISKRYIKGLIKEEDKIIIFLNLGTILTEKEKEVVNK